MTHADGITRCWWCGTDPLYVAYHDDDWGRPVRDERELYEKLVLDGAQAGLAWITILRKRETYRAAFEGFDPVLVAAYGDDDVARLLADPGIVRNRQKVAAAIGNAQALVAMHANGESLVDLVWSHAPKPRLRPLRPTDELPATSPEAEALSKALKLRGWKFVGPTIVYAYMQAVGVVDDHLAGCWRAS
ncbi:MAG: DNA-3-methyladenine glycosylase I [Acidimicrobiia bacterium]|nr:DNA-3-methyladenine glycosylase I [Acidimicrobiia bacterium]